MEAEDDNGLVSHCVNICLKMMYPMMTLEPRRLACGHAGACWRLRIAMPFHRTSDERKAAGIG